MKLLPFLRTRITGRLLALVFASVMAAASPANLSAATPPAVGDAAPAIKLSTLDAQPVTLSELTAKGPVVLLVLRGWPGYQCPFCTKQVHEFVTRAAEFRERGAEVLMVYPGPAEKLQAHAAEFAAATRWPENFHFVVDPDYTFTNDYGLRWTAKNETAYPSTFVIDRAGKVRFAHVSQSHGNRTTAGQVLAELK